LTAQHNQGVIRIIRLVLHTDFAESGSVMPAQVGIQGKQALASGSSAWIPAFAGTTWPRFLSYLYYGGLPVIGALLLTFSLSWLIPSSALAQGCAMCQTVLPQASEPIARGMFWCVLILLTAPFAVCATIGGWLIYQYRRASRSQSFTASVTPLRTALSNGQETV
jgi:hypothetical protein